MRVAVCEEGYAGAVVELVAGNQYAAHLTQTLTDRLDGYAAMAGDDSTATDFATAYDDAATESVAALASIVGAFAALARLTSASLGNHAAADARATLHGSHWAPRPPTVADQAVTLRTTTPPSSAGADDGGSGGPAGPAGMVLDLLAEVFWPNADTDRIHAAATTWHTTADSLHLLREHCTHATDTLAEQRSPEIPLALAALDQLHTHLGQLGDQLTDLATTCTDYATHVETKRAELLHLLEDLAWELGATALVGGALSLLSAGAAAGAAGGLGTARLAAATTKARTILDSLRLLTTSTALRTQPVTITASEVGAYTTKISRARVLLMEAGGRGGARPLDPPGTFSRGFLNRHENHVAHSLREHVGRTAEQLRQRFIDRPRLKHASSFRSQDEAEFAIERVFHLKRQEIARWMENPQHSKGFSADLKDEIADVGDVLIKKTGELVPVTKARIVLIPDETMPAGWRLLTAYPEL